MRQRNPGIDIVRILGVLAIVAGHIWFTEPLHRLLFIWHVPVFFFISGWLWKPRALREELAARSRTLLKPYALWLVVLLAAYVVVMAATGTVTVGRLIGPVYGGMYATQPFTTFWFVLVLFTAAVLWQIVESAPRWVIWPVLTIALVASVWFGPELARTPLSVGSAIPALLFVAGGVWTRRLGLGRPVIWAATAAGVLGFGLVFAGWVAPFDIKSGNWGTPITSVLVAVAISWALLVVAQQLCRRLPLRAANAITGFALCGFTIVLAHPAVLWALKPLELPQFVVFVLAIAAPTAIALVARRTPVSQWVTGTPPSSEARRPHAKDHIDRANWYVN